MSYDQALLLLIKTIRAGADLQSVCNSNNHYMGKVAFRKVPKLTEKKKLVQPGKLWVRNRNCIFLVFFVQK